MNQIANSLTILSLFCGFLSILLSLSGQFMFSAYAILLSVVLDGFDGQVARKNGVSSEFGKELDSLVDVVSFGIAPVLLGYIFVCNKFYFLMIAALFIYLLCVVIRLAKYNISVEGSEGIYFNGLPTTVGGGLLASFMLIYRQKEIHFEFIDVFFALLVLLLALLMVSKARYLNLGGIKMALGKFLKPVSLSLSIIFFLTFLQDKAGVAVFSIFLIYLIFSPFVVKRLNSV